MDLGSDGLALVACKGINLFFQVPRLALIDLAATLNLQVQMMLQMRSVPQSAQRR